MARTVTLETVEKRIAEKQLEVAEARKTYERRMDELRALMAKRDALRNERILDAVRDSGRSYEEILGFLINLKEKK